MTREELAREASRRTGLTMKEVQIVLVTILDIIKERMSAGDSVFIRGFGSFSVRKGRKRRVRDPRDEGVMEIPARYRPVFKAYPALKSAVQESLAPKTRVAFFCIGRPDANRVSVIGGFNEWDPGACPMQKLPDGSWFAELTLSSGQTISYCFWVDGTEVSDPAYPAGPGGRTRRQV